MNNQNESNVLNEELKGNYEDTNNKQPDLTLDSSTVNLVETPTSTSNHISTQKNIVVAVLFTINLVNFMDRFTIAGKMNQINI